MVALSPFLNYLGSKQWSSGRLYPPPAYDTIVEPFAGGAGYALRYGAGRRVILVERSPIVAGIWRYLISATEDEIMALPIVTGGEDLRDLDLPNPARDLIAFCVFQGLGDPCYKVPLRLAWYAAGAGRRDYDVSFWGIHRRERTARQLSAIRSWEVIEGDYTDAPDIEATWHIDPPYQHVRANYSKGWTTEDYPPLADWCRSRRGQVMVCEQAGADWLPFEFVGSVKGKTNRDGAAQRSAEVVWYSGTSDRSALVRACAAGGQTPQHAAEYHAMLRSL